MHGEKHLSLAEVDSAISTYDVLSDRKRLEKTFGVPVYLYSCLKRCRKFFPDTR